MRANSILSALSRLGGLLLLLTACCLPLTAQIRDFTRWVDPFIGTGGHGHTFPGAVMPFGMVQLSPDTRTDNWDGSSGYHYSDDIIYGFSHTHLSGTGIPDGCDILLMPTVGNIDFFNLQSTFREALRNSISNDKPMEPDWKKIDFHNYKSAFSHSDEKAEAGYYSVKMDNGVLAELTATQRVGFHRYTFPKTELSHIVLDLTWRDKVLDSEIKVASLNRIEGFRRSSSWAKDQAVYFVIEFSKPFKYYGMFDGIAELRIDKGFSMKGNELRSTFHFATKPEEQILVKVGISPVSIEGARKNLAAELPGWDFDKVRASAKAAWNKELSKIEVSGGTDAQTKTFYTALYHTMIHPSVFNDVDGNYRGLDGKTHNIADDAMPRRGEEEKGRKGANPKSKIQDLKSNQYTVFSLWDTFRAAHPLYTIIDQKRTVDFINSFIRMYEQGGRLPVWELWGEETDTMIGYHAVSVIADAMAKGIKGFDYEKAYAAAKHSAELDRDGLAAYKKGGYISMEDDKESVSKTLEYAYDDWCIANMAVTLGLKALDSHDPASDAKAKSYGADGKEFLRRSQSYENLFDPESGFMRPKVNGGFVKPFSPNEVTFNYTEGNAWVYSFFAWHNIDDLKRLYGGNANFAKKLDGLFTTADKLTGREQADITGLIGQYAHGNEPSHQIAYLYDMTDEPWKTQKYVRQILDDFYKSTPDGLIGNEDCGQMSAWYVLSGSGFFPMPPFALYFIGTPIFKEVKYHLENGKTFTVRAPNVSASNIYIRSVRLNGKRLKEPAFAHSSLVNGSVLEFDMSSSPVTDAFRPAGYYGQNPLFTAVPIIGDGRRTFRDNYKFTIKSITPDAQVCYTLDGSEPGCNPSKLTESPMLPVEISGRTFDYNGPITINMDTIVKAIAINSNGVKSQIAEAHYHRLPNDWRVKIYSKYNQQYTGGGDEGLIDGIRGSVNFADGAWQGYQGQDFVATIDLQKETEIKRVGGGFLQVARSWIWMPTHVDFEVSSDGVNFTRVADIRTDVSPTDMEPKIRDFVQVISPVRARYVRVHAYNFGKIPAWHPGAGGEAFIFVDEIFVQ